MATTTILAIKTYDANNNLMTITLDNPKANLTKAQILNAFSSAIQEGFILNSRSGLPMSRIGETSKTTTEKVIISGESVYFDPASPTVTISNSSTGEATVTITVYNAPVQASTVNSFTYSGASASSAANYTVWTTNTTNTVVLHVLTKEAVGITEGQYIKLDIEMEIVVEGISVFLNATATYGNVPT